MLYARSRFWLLAGSGLTVKEKQPAYLSICARGEGESEQKHDSLAILVHVHYFICGRNRFECAN